MNGLLALLERGVLRAVLSACDQVELALGEVLWESGNPIRQVYFPIESFVSQLVTVEDHQNLEVGLVGNEGMLGIPLVLGVQTSMFQLVVQGPGLAQRMESAVFLRALQRFPTFDHLLKRYICVSMAQIARTASCNSFHTLEARLARWLLLAHDRSFGGSFHITQDVLAQMLGVRRVGVTNAAGRLQKRHLISYNRGDITMLDRAGLETAACGCYRQSINGYRQFLNSMTTRK